MAQNYASQPVTRLDSSTAALAKILGLKATEGPAGLPAHVLDNVLALPLPDLKQHLDAETSDELRILRAFMGLGKAGAKEANKLFIFEEVEKLRNASADGRPPTIHIEDDSFADSTVPWTSVLPAP